KKAGKVDEATAKMPELWHGIIGPLLAKERFGVKDPEVLEAIACHTVGKPEMSMLAKIVYVADFGEYNRENGASMKIMRLIKHKNTSLDELVRSVTRQKIMFLLDNNRIIHKDGIELWNRSV
ncbi:MAG: bis(5'-nucleosyl)-tetraphosphatase (symmetrical) YqeK, partial [Spirochaetia bacterium]|nr:bis(5'-nucleosyl)-tetraphosphatase (symmetrical) YqeK [Spirochaetia bacterium]